MGIASGIAQFANRGTSMRHTRTLAIAATAALAVAGLAACGGGKQASASGTSGTASVPMVSVADAMSATSQATQKYTSVVMTMKEQVTAQGKQVDISGNGKVSWKPL